MQTIPDFIVTPLVIAAMLFVAWKIEWVARHAWRVIRLILIIAVVPGEILLIAALPALGFVVAAITIAFAVARYTCYVEKRALERQMELLKPQREAWEAAEQRRRDLESRTSYR